MLKKMLAYKKQQRLVSYGIVYTNQSARAEKWQAELTLELGLKPAFVMPTSTVVALSAGDGSVAIAYELELGGN